MYWDYGELVQWRGFIQGIDLRTLIELLFLMADTIMWEVDFPSVCRSQSVQTLLCSLMGPNEASGTKPVWNQQLQDAHRCDSCGQICTSTSRCDRLCVCVLLGEGGDILKAQVLGNQGNSVTRDLLQQIKKPSLPRPHIYTTISCI